MESVYRNWAKNKKAATAVRRAFGLPPEEELTDALLGCYLRNLYQNAVRSEEPSSFNLNTGLKIVFYDKRYYFFPESQGLFEKVLDFIASDKEVEDYSFNMRKSPRMSQEDWEERYRTWHAIVHDSDAMKLALSWEFMNVDFFEDIDPALDPPDLIDEMSIEIPTPEPPPKKAPAKPATSKTKPDIVEEASKPAKKVTRKKRNISAPVRIGSGASNDLASMTSAPLIVDLDIASDGAT